MSEFAALLFGYVLCAFLARKRFQFWYKKTKELQDHVLAFVRTIQAHENVMRQSLQLLEAHPDSDSVGVMRADLERLLRSPCKASARTRALTGADS